MPPHVSESFRNALEVLSKSLVFPPISDECHDDDSSPQGFHELYLQRQGMEFAMPILFEDGMDYIECELYYAAHASTSSPTKRLSALHKQQQRQLLLSSMTSPTNAKSSTTSNNKTPMPSCIRRRRSSSSCTNNNDGSNSSNSSMGTCTYSESESSNNEDDPFGVLEHNNNNHHHRIPRTRRCSFAGMPLLRTAMVELVDDNDDDDSSSPSSSSRPSFLRSQSWDDLKRGVGFQEHVRVVTIHSAMDYPPEVRKNLWMSRRELSKSVRRALVSGAVRRKDHR
jgi:hypothetical protein